MLNVDPSDGKSANEAAVGRVVDVIATGSSDKVRGFHSHVSLHLLRVVVHLFLQTVKIWVP